MEETKDSVSFFSDSSSSDSSEYSDYQDNNNFGELTEVEEEARARAEVEEVLTEEVIAEEVIVGETVINSEYPKVDQPDFINISLYPHQLTTIYEMEKLEREKSVEYIEIPTPCNILSKEQYELINNNSDDYKYKLRTKIGILGDLVGYGKTLSVIGLIGRDKMKTHNINSDDIIKINHLFNNVYFEQTKLLKLKNAKLLNTTLVIMNQSLIKQWENEIGKSSLTYFSIVKKIQIDNIIPDNYDIILCSKIMFNGIIAKFHKHIWKRFIFDEASSTHIPNMYTCNAIFTWFISATYENLYNVHNRGRTTHYMNTIFPIDKYNMYYSLDDYNKVYNNILRTNQSRYSMYDRTGEYSKKGNYVKAILIKNPDVYARLSYTIEPPIHNYYSCVTSYINNILQDYVSTDISNMLAADNIKGAIEALGGETSNESIVSLVTKNIKIELKKAVFKIELYKKEKNSKDKSKKERYQKWVTKKEEYETKINILSERISETMTINNCPICIGEYDNPVLAPCCQNIFCGQCIIAWLQSRSASYSKKINDSCPNCRNILTINQLVFINEEEEGGGEEETKEASEDKAEEDEAEENEAEEDKAEEDEEEEKRRSNHNFIFPNEIELPGPYNKPNTILSIIKNNPNGKFIIFSQYHETFELIEYYFKQCNINYNEIKGSVTSRTNKINQFQRGEVPVILLNSEYNGSGINLQSATDVIIYHKMSKEMEIQVIGRAYRIGRVGTLNVHHLYAQE